MMTLFLLLKLKFQYEKVLVSWYSELSITKTVNNTYYIEVIIHISVFTFYK